MKSASRTAHQAHTCIRLPLEIKVSADVLLKLACWCRQQAGDSNFSTSSDEQGGSSWHCTSPPAPTERSKGSRSQRAAGPTVEATVAEQTAGAARATDADSGSATGSSQQPGGNR